MSEMKTKVIDGESFQISQPYAAGHTITEAEAKALNQVRSENIGNNLRSTVKSAKEKRDAGDSTEYDALTATVQAYDAAYVFTIGGVSATAKRDPYEKEAYRLAKELVKQKLAAAGRKISDIPEGLSKEEWDAKLEANYETVAGLEDVVKAARKNVDAKKKQSEALLSAIEV